MGQLFFTLKNGIDSLKYACYNIQKELSFMPTISMFRGIKITMYWADHMPPHFHATYGGEEVIVSIKEPEVLESTLPSR